MESITLVEENTTTETVVQNAVLEVANFLSIDTSQINDAKKRLPIVAASNQNMFGRGGVSLIQEPTGIKCEIALLNEDDRVSAIHEVTHWLHYASNSSLVSSAIENRQDKLRQRDQYKVLNPESVLKQFIGFEKAADIRLEEFSRRTGIQTLTINDLSQSEFVEILTKRLDQASGYQLIMLNRVIDPNPLPYDSVHMCLSRYEGYTDMLLGSDDSNNIDSYSKSATEETKDAARGIARDYESGLVQGTKTVEQIGSELKSGSIPLDSPIVRLELSKKAVDRLSNQQQLVAIENYLKTGSLKTTTDASVALTFLPIEERMGINNRDVPASLVEMESMRIRALEAIQTKRAEFQDLRVLPDLLKGLVNDEVNKADALTGLAIDSFLFFGDLPDDEQARISLLGNKEYVASVISTLLASESSPLTGILDSRPEDFALSERQASDTVQQASNGLFAKSSDIDIAGFVQREKRRILHKTDMGTNYLSWHERSYWESRFRYGKVIKKGHEDWTESQVQDEVEKTILDKAVIQSQEAINDYRTQQDLMLEPIAHVLTNLMTGEPISYRGGVMGFGVYADLLSAQDTSDPDSAVQNWHEKLTKLISKVQKIRSITPLIDFFKANSLEEQRLILGRY